MLNNHHYLLCNRINVHKVVKDTLEKRKALEEQIAAAEEKANQYNARNEKTPCDFWAFLSEKATDNLISLENQLAAMERVI